VGHTRALTRPLMDFHFEVAAGEEFSEVLTLNGQTGVNTTSEDCFRVNTMTVLSAGSSKFNEGTLYVGTGTMKDTTHDL